jgi:hypothetical protein
MNYFNYNFLCICLKNVQYSFISFNKQLHTASNKQLQTILKS